MIGVIVLPGLSPRMHGLDAHRSLALLPLGDRPVLQHIIESLVTQGITTIELIVSHVPEKVEALFGNGDRWGCVLRYHLAAQPERPYRSLKIISALKSEPWVLVHAERYPCVSFGPAPSDKPVLFCGPPGEGETSAKRWGGTALFPAKVVEEAFASCTPEELQQHFDQMAAKEPESVVTTDDWIDASTPAHLLESQTRLLSGKLGNLMISGNERQPGIWLSRNVAIHPSVQLVAPLYVGPNCRLNSGVRVGPNTVISGDCIIDTNTTIEDSLVIEGSYVGEALELNEAVVAHNLLVNIRLDASARMSENFLLGSVERPRRQTWLGYLVQSTLALCLMILFLPVTFLSLLAFSLVRHMSYTPVRMVRLPVDAHAPRLRSYSLLGLGAGAWKVHQSAGWESFLRQFLPGLFAVFCGRLNLVGLPPRTEAEIEALPEEWQALYLKGKAGLITEASSALTESGDEMQLYLMDAYYSVRNNWSHDLGLALKYFLRLLVPNPKRGGRMLSDAQSFPLKETR